MGIVLVHLVARNLIHRMRHSRHGALRELVGPLLRRHGLLRHGGRRSVEALRRHLVEAIRGRGTAGALRGVPRDCLTSGRAVHLVRVVRRVLLVLVLVMVRVRNGHALLRHRGVVRVRLRVHREASLGGGDVAAGDLAVQTVPAVAADDAAVDDERDEEQETTRASYN